MKEGRTVASNIADLRLHCGLWLKNPKKSTFHDARITGFIEDIQAVYYITNCENWTN